MGINANQLRTFIIRPTLSYLNLWSNFRENLILGTCAQESNMGTYISQLNGGPARGIYQMEEKTYEDIWENFLKFNGVLYKKISDIEADDKTNLFFQLTWNLKYATAMAFMSYFRHKKFVDLDPKDIEGMANYWKKYYNSSLGKGTEQEFIDNYDRYIIKSS
jgi:hypothetical protein